MPVRCFTCGKVVCNLLPEYEKLTKVDNVSIKEAFDKIGIKRYCCKRMFMCNVDVTEKLFKYCDVKFD
jgi:DNA-directed RNA polymerase subunit N (RpoN/RPB10)